MRTIFVNPSRVRRRRRARPSSNFRAPTRRRRRSHRRRRRNAGITPFVRNPSLIQNPRRRRRRRNPFSMPKVGNVLMDVGVLALGTVGGAGLNRLGLIHIPNFYMRNGARVVTAAILAAWGGKSPAAAAAAGAVMAPMLPEIEMQMASVVNKTPQQLAADLAGLLEEDLSNGSLSADLSDDLIF